MFGTLVSVSCLCRSCRASVCPFSLSCRVASCSFISLCSTTNSRSLTSDWYSVEQKWHYFPFVFAQTASRKHCQSHEMNDNIFGRQIFLHLYSIYLNCIICVTALVASFLFGTRQKRFKAELQNKQGRWRARYERDKNEISGGVGLCQRKLGLI